MQNKKKNIKRRERQNILLLNWAHNSYTVKLDQTAVALQIQKNKSWTYECRMDMAIRSGECVCACVNVFACIWRVSNIYKTIAEIKCPTIKFIHF